MKKTGFRSALAILVFALGITLTFSGTLFAYSKKHPMVLKCGIANPPMDIKARTIKRLGDMITEKTHGRIQFKYFYGASLIQKPAFVDAVARGIADISTGPISFVTGKMPELSPLEIYGAYDLSKHLQMIKAIRPILVKSFTAKGVYPIFEQFTGNCIFAERNKFLKTPADWKGLKMRLAGRWQSTLGKMWGASPVFMPPADLYLACQRGVVDGYMLIYDITYGLKLYEVTPYITDTTFSNNLEIVTMNLRKWKRLTKEDQKIFRDCADELEPWNMKETLAVDEKIKKDMVAKGAKIYILNAAEKAAYLKDSFSLWPEVAKVSGPMGRKLMEILKQYR